MFERRSSSVVRAAGRLLGTWLMATGGVVCAADFTPDELDDFERRVRPILAERCYPCHSARQGKRQGGLELDSRAALLRGGDSGPAIEPGKPATSLLIAAIRHADDAPQMPPTGKLTPGEIEILQAWVARGAPHPAASVSPSAVDEAQAFLDRRRHWSFQPLRVSEPTRIRSDLPGSTWIDGHLEAARRQHGLNASPRADARTLIRRLSFTLTGLPPTPAEVDDFISASAVDPSVAYVRLIDRLLASPRYGEHWGRVWLDLVRYADVTESWREGEGEPWRYRDWVVKAWNDDLPYDTFVRQQMAADLLPNARPEDNAALGLLGLSPSYWKELKLDHQLIKLVVAEEWEERLDTLGTTFLGLSLGCARCHDHKFDPITAHDYYAMAGVLASIRTIDRPLIDEAMAAPALAARAQVKKLDQQLKPLAAKREPSDEEQAKIASLREEIARWRATPNFDLPLACGVVDAALHVLPSGQDATRLEYRPGEAQDLAMQIRGNPARTGEIVPRGFLEFLSTNPQRTFRQGSGRLELAEALVTDAAPLTARVIVNRVWKQHFGRGIVDTPSNFGLQGSPPSHPELLDVLAARFIAAGWSLKWLQRELVTSAAFQQAGYRDPDRQAIDPENQFLWRMTPRRLNLEAWRDSMLAVGGTLSEHVGGAPFDLSDAGQTRRTLYAQVKRRELHEWMRLYDFPDPVTHSPQREPTITPLQQLFVLNNPLVDRLARSIAERLLRTTPPAVDDRVAWLTRTAFQRPPRGVERELAVDFLRDAASRQVAEGEAWRRFVHMILASNEFLFID